MSYKGKYYPRYPKKYKGNPQNIIYRSLWERKFMNYCDLNETVSEWQSEEFWIPYRSPIDNRVHRYFPDFFLKYIDKKGKKRTKSWAQSVQTYAVNQAKWKAAREFCADRNFEFKIMTEDNLGIK